MTKTARLLALTLLLTTIGCDRVTKHLASTKLADEAVHSFWNDVIRVQYAENTGAFLSLGATLPDWARTGLLTVGAALGVVLIALAALKLQWRGSALAGAALFAAGGVSNVFDRVTRGAVIDFLNVGVGSLRTGIFNVADVAIMIGAALIVLGTSRIPRPPRVCD
jgi:signal peptidase II